MSDEDDDGAHDAHDVLLILEVLIFLGLSRAAPLEYCFICYNIFLILCLVLQEINCRMLTHSKLI